MGIEVATSTTYHPQTDGQMEQVNHSTCGSSSEKDRTIGTHSSPWWSSPTTTLIDKNAKGVRTIAADAKTEERRIAMEKSLASSV